MKRVNLECSPICRRILSWAVFRFIIRKVYKTYLLYFIFQFPLRFLLFHLFLSRKMFFHLLIFVSFVNYFLVFCFAIRSNCCYYWIKIYMKLNAGSLDALSFRKLKNKHGYHTTLFRLTGRFFRFILQTIYFFVLFSVWKRRKSRVTKDFFKVFVKCKVLA